MSDHVVTSPRLSELLRMRRFLDEEIVAASTGRPTYKEVP